MSAPNPWRDEPRRMLEKQALEQSLLRGAVDGPHAQPRGRRLRAAAVRVLVGVLLIAPLYLFFRWLFAAIGFF